jgi:hypothetical protein
MSILFAEAVSNETSDSIASDLGTDGVGDDSVEDGARGGSKGVVEDVACKKSRLQFARLEVAQYQDADLDGKPGNIHVAVHIPWVVVFELGL